MATAAEKREQDFINDVRTLNRQLWEGINGLKALQREWTAKDFGNTLDTGTGENLGITGADVGAVVFATTDAIIDILNTGHATNCAKLL